jgi:hypothetical protein
MSSDDHELDTTPLTHDFNYKALKLFMNLYMSDSIHPLISIVILSM